MDTDLALILGLVLAVFSVPSLVSAFSDNRPPFAPLAVLGAGAALMIYAMLAHPEGYRLADVPDVFFSVIARFIP